MGSLPTVDIRRSGDRSVTVAGGVRTAHSFSGGRHYDPANTSFGPLVLHDEHRLAPGSGFAAHRHRGVEVVSWVLEGALRHEDDTGTATVVGPGQVQRLATGSGAVHAEVSHGAAPVRFVQAWLLADDTAAPAYDVRDVAPLLAGGGLVTVASGTDDAPVRLTVDAALHVARPCTGASFLLPAAPRVHLHVAAGAVEVGGIGALGAGDAVRLTGGPGRRLTTTATAEVLVWTLP